MNTAANAARLANSGAGQTQLIWRAMTIWAEAAWGRGEKLLPLAGPPTGKPDAGNPPVRFGGRGAVIRSPNPYCRNPCPRFWSPTRGGTIRPCRRTETFKITALARVVLRLQAKPRADDAALGLQLGTTCF